LLHHSKWFSQASSAAQAFSRFDAGGSSTLWASPTYSWDSCVSRIDAWRRCLLGLGRRCRPALLPLGIPLRSLSASNLGPVTVMTVNRLTFSRID
jgi:hypothetical protein